MAEKILTPLIETPHCEEIDTYLGVGGYEAIRKALTMTPEAVIAEVSASNLRGLGGAGFPTGRKWQFIPKDVDKPKYLIANADESEPGTFKDKYIMVHAPHVLLEGMMIASYAIGAHRAYIYIRGEYVRPAEVLEGAIRQAYERGFLGKNIFGSGYELDIVVHRGAGAYICGEETALLESLEGKKGWPRMKPPFPAVEGFLKSPTIVNNVETLSYVPAIITHGGAWFAQMGTERSGGVRLFSVSGHVNKPGVYELPLGTPLREIIFDHAGGVLGGRKLKAVIPGGSSSPVLRADEIDVPMDFDSLNKIGSMLGSAGVIVMDETTCMVKALLVVTRFYRHESCGQCTPCREGTGWAEKILQRIVSGQGRPEDVDNLHSVADGIIGNTICPLGDAAALPILSFVKKFREEFEYYVREGRSMVDSGPRAAAA